MHAGSRYSWPDWVRYALAVEVVGLEQRRRPLARRGREDRRVDEHEAAIVEEVAAGLQRPRSARAARRGAFASAGTGAGGRRGTRPRAPWAGSGYSAAAWSTVEVGPAPSSKPARRARSSLRTVPATRERRLEGRAVAAPRTTSGGTSLTPRRRTAGSRCRRAARRSGSCPTSASGPAQPWSATRSPTWSRELEMDDEVVASRRSTSRLVPSCARVLRPRSSPGSGPGTSS